MADEPEAWSPPLRLLGEALLTLANHGKPVQAGFEPVDAPPQILCGEVSGIGGPSATVTPVGRKPIVFGGGQP